MRIVGEGGSIEIGIAGDSDPYGVEVTVTVQVDGFAGTTSSFVLIEEWRAFVAGVEALDQARQGEARLQSIAPGEIEITLRSTDRAGHTAFEGQIAQRAYIRVVYLRFGLVPFDPTELPRIVRELRAILGQ